MGLFSFLVMATPRKENKRCHLTTGQTPNEKKRNRPGGHIQGHTGSRKSLAYDSVEQNNKVRFLYILLSTSSYFLCWCIRGVLQRSLVGAAKKSCRYIQIPFDKAYLHVAIQGHKLNKHKQFVQKKIRGATYLLAKCQRLSCVNVNYSLHSTVNKAKGKWKCGTVWTCSAFLSCLMLT